MSAFGGPKLKRLAGGAAGVVALALLWQSFAGSGVFPAALAPGLPAIGRALTSVLADGLLLHHSVYTLGRVLLALTMASALAIPLGIWMGRSAGAEQFLLPLVSSAMPIPSLALVPLFILWFGLGNVTTLLAVFYAATFPLLYNVWTGVRSIDPILVRSARSMGTSERQMFWKVILPGALPYIITGIRQSFGRAWISVVGAELLSGTEWGLGRLIFDSREFLKTDVMIVALVAIGTLGVLFESVVFRSIDARTVARWGMISKEGE